MGEYVRIKYMTKRIQELEIELKFSQKKLEILEEVLKTSLYSLKKITRPDTTMRNFGKRLEAVEKEIKVIKDAPARE